MKQKYINTDFYNQILKKNIEWDTDEKGIVYLIKEKSSNKFMKRLIDLFGKSQYFRIHLDETGSLVWSKINGKLTIRQIGESVQKEKIGEDFLHGEKRVLQFLTLMLKNKFVGMV